MRPTIHTFIISCMLFLFMSVLSADAQNKIKELSIGDRCPDFQFEKVYNYGEPSASLSDFASRLIILDFWASWCKPCISSFPKLNELQEKFDSEIAILPVTKDPISKVQKVYNSFENFILPSVYDDDLLIRYFPHRIIPHVVWIDKNGMVQAITSHEEVNEENIEAFLKLNNLTSVKRKSDIVGFNMEKPLSDQLGLSDDHFLFKSEYSILTKHIPGVSTHVKMAAEESGQMKRFYARNMKLIYLFHLAYCKSQIIVPNKNLIRFDLNDSSKVFKEIPVPEGTKWRSGLKSGEEDLYCYELELPAETDSATFYKYMMDDLNKVFEIKGIVKKEKIPCWIIVNANNGKQPDLSIGGEFKNEIDYDTNTILEMKNQPVVRLAQLVNRNFMDIHPFVDESGYEHPVNLRVNLRYQYPDKKHGEYLDIEALNRILQTQGLEIVYGERVMDILVITDKALT